MTKRSRYLYEHNHSSISMSLKDSTDALGPNKRVQRIGSPSTPAVSITPMHSPFFVPQIKFPADCDLEHYYQDFPHSSTAPLPSLSHTSTTSTPSSSSRSPPPSDSPAEHIPRPPNAFMLFRSDFLKRHVIPRSVEKRQQTLSRVAGEIWNLMPAEEKKSWYDKAAEALTLHKKNYPNYKFSPVRRGSGRKSKAKASEKDLKNKDHIREIREIYLDMQGPAVAPLRRRSGKQQYSTLEDKKPGIRSESSNDRFGPIERSPSEPREPAKPPSFPQPTNLHLLADDFHPKVDVKDRCEASYGQRLVMTTQDMSTIESRFSQNLASSNVSIPQISLNVSKTIFFQ
ncbi:hypothetical protein F5890DRAFT_1499428 [Lentinula detonsa]|uniref:HMG box domain-containing protein n=1 Tax=Lentinula detonsa TaxID=2804962 RepID=A0AA38UVL3_9AGAR|nr:hypothetical protein F5890DRAFT_1499428 [Lentinula detonsa]